MRLALRFHAIENDLLDKKNNNQLEATAIPYANQSIGPGVE